MIIQANKEVLVTVLERENAFKKVIKMQSGDMPKSSALDNIKTVQKRLLRGW